MVELSDRQIRDNANFIWSVANTLRNHFKASEYGKTILPMTVLRRLDSVVDPIADDIKAAADSLKPSITEKSRNRILNKKAGARFHSISGLTMTRLLADPENIKENIKSYINGLSPNIRHVFIEDFEFFGMVDRLDRQGILYDVIKHFVTVDLSPDNVSTIEMGYIFENLLRRFNEESNASSGEHFTPREVIQLMTSLLFCKDGEVLASEPRVLSIHDPACGSGGMLATAESYLKDLNQDLDVQLCGQEVNPESYAICRSDMLITDHDPDNIRLGNTLTQDRFKGQEFSYQLSNPPYGTSYKPEQAAVLAEHEAGGGRFDVAIPPVDDGQLLFLLHMISKMSVERGGRIAIIMSGSPLFNDSAGGKQSEIRRYILENDWLEGLVALPTNLFYNAQIGTYIWILSNRKLPEDAKKVRLVNATELYAPMKKNLGSKNRELTEAHVKQILDLYMGYQRGEKVLDLAPDDFGYRQIKIERPLRLDVDLAETEEGYFRNMTELDPYFIWIDKQIGDFPETKITLALDKIRARVQDQEGYTELQLAENPDKAAIAKAKKTCNRILKSLTSERIYIERRQCLHLIRDMRQHKGTAWGDYNLFLTELEGTAKHRDIRLTAKHVKMIRAWVTATNPGAERVIDKDVSRKNAADWRYGFFAVCDRVLTFEKDSDLSDDERVPLDQDIVEYCDTEVWPHAPDAWINGDVVDSRDGKVGKKGYEINFNRYFYKYEPPRLLQEIDRDLKQVEKEIAELLAGVTQ